jgi:uncharacterized protein (DUF1800 family)
MTPLCHLPSRSVSPLARRSMFGLVLLLQLSWLVTTAAHAQAGVQTVQITATDPDGTNTGTARLGVPVSLTATVTAGKDHDVTWKVAGGGTIAVVGGSPFQSATYTPPAAIPSGTVTITVYLTNAATVVATYSLAVINPLPAVAATSPTQLLTGGTQPVTLTGAGFMPGTTVSLNGSALPTTYTSSSQISTQVPVAANASGGLSLQVQNPAPGGGATTFIEPVAPNSISLTATDQDGVNTGTAELGINVTMAAAVTGSEATTVTWSVAGGGSISAAGVYTSPANMPSSSAVTITATLASNPAITASYSLTLLSSVPTISSASLAGVPAGTTTAVTLTGTNFLPSTTLTATGGTVTTTYQSATSLLAQVTLSAAATGNLTLQAQNPPPGGGTSSAFSLPVWTIQVSAADSDGTNTGTARLGVPVNLTSSPSAGPNTAVSYTLTGAGTLTPGASNSATYTPPQTMPSNTSVTITAAVSGLPALTASYAITLVNPIPAVSASSPSQLLTDGTQTLTINGSGFVAGTAVSLNGTSLPVSFVSYSQVSVPVAVPANATGSLSLQLKNPTPGGGSATFAEPLASPAISLTATNQQGTNTGTAQIGTTVNMAAAVTGSVDTTVVWSVTGSGSITTAGVYTAPATLPSSDAVTITASVTSNPAVTASYQLTLTGAPPTITTASVSDLLAGSTTSVTLTGTGFLPGVSLIATNGTVVTTTYKSGTSVVAQITISSGASGTFSLQAANPAPGGGTSNSFQIPVWSLAVVAVDPDGTNTGNARLGVPVTLTATASAGSNNSVNWALNGGGSIQLSGTNNTICTYTPPHTMPTSAAVTLTASVSGVAALTTSYNLTLINPVPVITATSPTSLLTDGTQNLVLNGSGFVAGTTVSLNGALLTTTYNSYNKVTVAVPVPANAAGLLNLQVQNAAPGGGGVVVAEPVAPQVITLTAYDNEGANTGTASLNETVNMSAAVTGSEVKTVTWSVTGGGSISSSGVYTTPTVMPSPGTAIITAVLTSNPSVTASYTVNLINADPTISSATVSKLAAGATASVNLVGSGFNPSTTFAVSSGTITTTYNSPSSITAQITLPATASGTYSIQAVNPAPGGGTSAAFQIPIWTITLTATDPDGTGTGTARLGIPVNLAVTDVDTGSQYVTWNLTGPGTITLSGTYSQNAVYTPPQTASTATSVVITAYMSAFPSLTTSYTLNLINPAPVVTSASPTQLLVAGTQTVTLNGSGLLPTTTVTYNGTSLPVTYANYNKISVPVTLGANVTGPVNLVVQNAAPGGGSANVAETVATPALAVTATDQDGTNTGTAELGISVTMSATASGIASTAVTWTVTGAGSITSAGVYTAPVSMPSSPAVTITAALNSNPSVTASYQLNLIYPAPTLTKASVAGIPAGTTTAVTITGTGFLPGTVFTTSVGSITATYVSATSETAQITLPPGASGNLSILAQNGGINATLSVPIWTIAITATDADGTNTGTARLAVPVNLVATAFAGSNAWVGWTITSGPGSISMSGTDNVDATYTPPTTMPTGTTTVVITAAMSAVPSLSTTYTLTIVYPVPTVTSETPAQLTPGSSTTVSLVGTGFESGMVVNFNGAQLPVTISSSTHASVKVSVPPTDSGSTISLQVQNPTPGGGPGTTFTVPLATSAIALTATDGDGTNTGTAELGVNVTMAAAVTGSASTAVTWSVNGAGSISTSGVYTAPSVMPASAAVTITATLTSNPAITASYQLNLINPTPVISKASLGGAPAGATTTVTLTGTGFVAGTAFSATGGTITTTYVSPTSVTAQVTLAASASGNLSIVAHNSAPGGGTGAAFQLPIYTIVLSATDSDGSNTGTARLGVPVSLSAATFAGASQDVSWVLNGAGTLKVGAGAPFATATYTPPLTMPASTGVTITAYMTGLPSLTTTYAISLVNPIPVVTANTPAQLLTGGTQTVTLTGTGFVPGTFVVMNGSPLVTTFVSPTSVTVAVPVTATATGTLSLQVQNPAPGGGAGTTFTESVDTDSITVTATDQDGTNTGTAELGINVNFTASVSGADAPAVTWTVAGPGSISTSGIYTAPAVMPTSSNQVTVTAALVSNPSVTASYAFSIINPVPTIVSASQYVVSTAEANNITLNGSGFVPSTVFTATNATITSTYQSATSMLVQIVVNPGTTGVVVLQAENPSPGGGSSPTFNETITTNITATAAARLLDQTTFGPTAGLIQTVQGLGVNGWLAEQFNAPPTLMAPLTNPYPAGCNEAIACAESEWWQAVLTGNDQLRQRVAFALSQTWVISTDSVLGNAIPQYQNIFLNDAFTNWFQIMQDVTRNPGMGIYLNMAQSAAAAAGSGQIANENYAREDMQLFNMGLYLLNQDGTLQLDANGNPIPAYTEAQVQAFARVFTGWTFANSDGSTPPWLGVPPNYNYPMVAVEAYHDENPKLLLDDQNPLDYSNGTTLPAGQTAEQDLYQGLQNVFMHPNVPPFVSRLLIQHLVTSNPSPGYVSRVAAVFTNNGNNVRGDMKAVITAILTDPEARAADNAAPAAGFGHLREPILWMTGVLLGLGDVNVDPNNNYTYLSYYTNYLNERPFQASDVFNFFPPSYVIPGIYTSGVSLNAPEFGIEDSGSVMERVNVADTVLGNYLTGFNLDLSSTSPLGQLAATNPAAMVDQLGLIFMHAQMDPNIRAAIVNEISTISVPQTQVMVAAYLVVTSSQYKIVQ